MAESWWSQRFLNVLESYGLGGRMERGRRYARAGQVLGLEVLPGLLVSQVQGTRPTPYVVTIRAPALTPEQWREVDAAMRSRVGFAARLLDGEVPDGLEEVFAAAGVELIPSRWSALSAHCTCPDYETPCKHIAAVLYLLADRLDVDPWLLLAWRGRTREQVLAHLAVPGGRRLDERLPPWWPLAPGPLPPSVPAVIPAAEPPDPPGRVLERLDRLYAWVDGAWVETALSAAYEALYGMDDAPAP